MFYQILLFMPLKIVFGAFFSIFFFKLHSVFLIFLQSRSWGGKSGKWTCLFEDPTWRRPSRQTPTQTDSSKKKKKEPGRSHQLPPSSQINGGRTWKPAGSAAGPPVWEWCSLMDRDVHLASTRHALAHLRVLLHLSLLPPASSCAQPQAGCL